MALRSIESRRAAGRTSFVVAAAFVAAALLGAMCGCCAGPACCSSPTCGPGPCCCAARSTSCCSSGESCQPINEASVIAASVPEATPADEIDPLDVPQVPEALVPDEVALAVPQECVAAAECEPCKQPPRRLVRLKVRKITPKTPPPPPAAVDVAAALQFYPVPTRPVFGARLDGREMGNLQAGAIPGAPLGGLPAPGLPIPGSPAPGAVAPLLPAPTPSLP
jgi:hypothetical protein